MPRLRVKYESSSPSPRNKSVSKALLSVCQIYQLDSWCVLGAFAGLGIRVL